MVIRLFVGMDLHSNNVCMVIIDELGKRVFKNRFPNDTEEILAALNLFKKDIVGIVVESTYNWYFLVDALQEAGYDVRLAHVPKLRNYSGKKHTNDFTEAYDLADSLRKGELPEGYIYPKEDRPIRDLSRKRIRLVRTRTQFFLSLNSLISRQVGLSIATTEMRKMEKEHLDEMFKNDYLTLSGQVNLNFIASLDHWIQLLEEKILEVTSLKPEFQKLLTIIGVGKILALTIALETGCIKRFANAGKFSSYCRSVESKRESNGKKKGENNRKNGNAYLAWAFIEAAIYAKRYCPYAKAFYQRKFSQTRKQVIALKALANKLAKAAFYIMRDQVDYDVSKIFHVKKSLNIECGSEPARTLENPRL